MAMELAAGRLAARQLGSSLHTWTAVIGITLAGMTLGNYFGGRVADRSAGKQIISSLLAIASMACVGTIILSHRIEQLLIFRQLSWPVYVFIHIALLFFLPSVFLGAIYPVAAKAALDSRPGTGRTIGNIYAFGAAGSIAGTFAAGFWLIPAIGANGVIWITASALMVSGLIFCPGYRSLQLWTGILVLLVFLVVSQNPLLKKTAAFLNLTDKPGPNDIYVDETRYCQIRINRKSDRPDKRVFYQDRLSHSIVIMDDINDLQYEYERICSEATILFCRDKKNPAFLLIGGGGFVFPRYLRHRWPAGVVDVAEIDPGVVEAAIAAFGMPKNHDINIFTMDARNFVDGRLSGNQPGKNVRRYDFIYGDAYDNYIVPYQLVTKEFNEKLARILSNDGYYMLNLIDIYDSGLVLGSVVNTMKQTFGNVCVFSPSPEYYRRTTFIVIASQQTIDTDSLIARFCRYYRDVWLLNPSEIDTVIAKSGKITLTDDYAPTDNLAAAISFQAKSLDLANAYLNKANQLSQAGQWDKTVKLYMKAVELECPLAITDYFSITEFLLAHREYEETVLTCQKAFQYYDKPQVRKDISPIHLNMGLALNAQGKSQEARIHFNRAIEQCRQNLKKEPNAIDSLSVIGAALAATGEYSEAAEYFRRAVKISPSKLLYRYNLIDALVAQKNYEAAMTEINDATDYMNLTGNKEAASIFQRLSDQISRRRSQSGR